MLVITIKDNYTGRSLRLSGKLLEILQCKQGRHVEGVYLDLFIPECVAPACKRLMQRLDVFLDPVLGECSEQSAAKRCAAQKSNAKYHASKAQAQAIAAEIAAVAASTAAPPLAPDTSTLAAIAAAEVPA